MNQNNTALIKTFYEALSKLDYKTMQACYHPQATFYDPVFGQLNAQEVMAMWEMLCKRAQKFSLTYSNIEADSLKGKGECVAKYVFTATGRPVSNHIEGRFKFKDGKFIEHMDYFNMWKWSRQALGISGWLFGWLLFYQKAIRKKARKGLEKFRS